LNASAKQIQDEPAIKSLLSRMPTDVAGSFSEQQLTHLFTAIGDRSAGRHAVDLRGTFKIPFHRWRFYYVFLVGRNRRDLTRQEVVISTFTISLFVALFIMFSIALGLLTLYLLKSAAGINLLPGVSLGIWDWFKRL
jgi:hypothetical protein